MIEIYTTDRCPKCIIVKGLLHRKKIAYVERKLVTEEEKNAFISKYNVKTVPYLISDGEVIGDAAVASLWIQEKYGEK